MVISWNSQLNASASLNTKSHDEYKNSNKITDNPSKSPSTQGTNYSKQPSETINRNLSSKRKSLSNLVTSTEIQSRKTVPQESKSNRGEN
jgi:hypothetical protein